MRLKEDRPPELKKGHQNQFEINEEVKEKLTEAETTLSRMPAAVESARTAIAEGMSLINKRQKLLKSRFAPSMDGRPSTNTWRMNWQTIRTMRSTGLVQKLG